MNKLEYRQTNIKDCDNDTYEELYKKYIATLSMVKEWRQRFENLALKTKINPQLEENILMKEYSITDEIKNQIDSADKNRNQFSNDAASPTKDEYARKNSFLVPRRETSRFGGETITRSKTII